MESTSYKANSILLVTLLNSGVSRFTENWVKNWLKGPGKQGYIWLMTGQLCCSSGLDCRARPVQYIYQWSGCSSLVHP